MAMLHVGVVARWNDNDELWHVPAPRIFVLVSVSDGAGQSVPLLPVSAFHVSYIDVFDPGESVGALSGMWAAGVSDFHEIGAPVFRSVDAPAPAPSSHVHHRPHWSGAGYVFFVSPNSAITDQWAYPEVIVSVMVQDSSGNRGRSAALAHYVQK